MHGRRCHDARRDGNRSSGRPNRARRFVAERRRAGAQSAYYSANASRDPVARWALGKYLVSRGAPRVGVTLFEEALQFGGDASVVNAELAPAYLALGEYHKLSALKASPLSVAERERARWLVARSTRLSAPDSISTIPYRKPSDSTSLGRIVIQSTAAQWMRPSPRTNTESSSPTRLPSRRDFARSISAAPRAPFPRSPTRSVSVNQPRRRSSLFNRWRTNSRRDRYRCSRPLRSDVRSKRQRHAH